MKSWPVDLTIAARVFLAAAGVLCFLTLARALTITAPPRSEAPQLNPVQSRARPSLIAEAELVKAADSFGLLAADSAEPVRAPAPAKPADPLRLVGTVPLPNGGLAAVESPAGGSRLLRVGDRWNGLQLREVSAGRAVFTDSVSGANLTISIRKAGS